ncbi:MAG: hypothetical protein ACI81Y_001791 [Glaciecola sp.]|jgi:hypothetical protein
MTELILLVIKVKYNNHTGMIQGNHIAFNSQ